MKGKSIIRGKYLIMMLGRRRINVEWKKIKRAGFFMLLGRREENRVAYGKYLRRKKKKIDSVNVLRGKRNSNTLYNDP